MLSKCIGIISYFPDDEVKRKNRKNKFNILIQKLNTYFKLPIIIIAQNWREEDFNIKYNNLIKIYSWSGPLGITRARILLREKLLLEDYDYFILLDDDSNITCSHNSVREYFSVIDAHPDMFGLFKGESWHRLLAISKTMYQVMNYDYIKDMEPSRGELWEDVAYIHTYKTLYPNKWYVIKINGLMETQLPSEKDKDSTWYRPEFKDMWNKTQKIKNEWVKSLQ